MAYTICDKYGEPMPLRLLMARDEHGKNIEVGDEFTPCWWVCDPCNPSSRRFEITFRSNQEPQPYPWYQVVVSDDGDEDIDLKMAHYRKVIEARRALEAARREFERLNG